MFECPITYFKDNLIFNQDKSCWAVYCLQGYDYDLLSNEEKINVLHRLTKFICGITTEAKILIIPVVQDIKEHFNHLRDRLDQEDPLYHDAYCQANLTEDYLDKSAINNGSINDYKTYIVVKLETNKDVELFSKFKDAYDYFVKSPVNAFNVYMAMDGVAILKSQLQKFQKLSQKFFFEQNKRINMNTVQSEEIQWLIRRMVFRGLNKDVQLFYKSAENHWTPDAEEVELENEIVLKPDKRQIVNLFSGVIKVRDRVLKIDHGNDQVSYQTFLAITNIPEIMEFPNCEWIYLLQQYNTQAEICIHIRTVDFRKSLDKLEKKKREINSHIEHIVQANSDITEELLEGKDYAEILERELKGSKSPTCKTSITICLSDKNPEVLEDKATLVKQEYEDMNFVLERPLTDQLKLFFQMIPSTGICAPDFIINLTPQTLASGIIGATHQLGDSIGPYIGTTGVEMKQVFLDMGLACRTDKSAVATFYGNLGFGKSFNANLLLYLLIMFCNAYGLIFDPKSERTHWITKLKVFDGLINLVTLSSEIKYTGTLDPFNIYRTDIEEACELATNVITELLGLEPTDRKSTVLLISIQKMKHEELPSMLRLIEILYSFDRSDNLHGEAMDLARSLDARKDNGMTRLLFGNGTEKAITMDNRLNILQITNLKLPEPHVPKQSYSREQSLSVILMMVMGNFAKKFIQSFPNNLKVILFDESWMLGRTTEGKNLISFLTRTSRSLYAAVILNGHSVLDIPDEGIKTTITYKFCFHTDSHEEAERMLKYLNLEITPSNLELIMNLKNKQCLFQDLNKRVGILTFDAVFDDVISVFSTTPQDKSELKKEYKEIESVTEAELVLKSNEAPEPESVPELNAASEPEPDPIQESESMLKLMPASAQDLTLIEEPRLKLAQTQKQELTPKIEEDSTVQEISLATKREIDIYAYEGVIG